MTMTTLNFIANGEKQPLFFDLYIGRISSLINSDKIDEFIRESNGCRKMLISQIQDAFFMGKSNKENTKRDEYFEKYFLDFDFDFFKEAVKTEKLKCDMYHDEISIKAYYLIEILRAFKSLKEDDNSYLNKAFKDDHCYSVINGLNKKYESYFGEKFETEQYKIKNQIKELENKINELKKNL